MNESAKTSFVIVGNGVAAWATAASLSRLLDPVAVSIYVVDDGGSPSGQPFGLGDGTLPTPADFITGTLPREDQLVVCCGAAWSFGIALTGWAAPDVTYFHPFGSVGAPFGPVAFHQVVQRMRQEGVNLRMGDFALSAMAAQAGRFQLPSNNPGSVLSTLRNGLHIDLARMAGRERSAALSGCARLADGVLNHVERTEDGAIAALLTDSGERVEGDLFIDCSGTDARLAADTPGTGWEDWSAWLPCDSVASAVAETPDPPLPYSHAEAHPWGSVQFLPMQQQTVLNAVFSAEHATESDIWATFRKFAGGEPSRYTGPQAVSFGRRRFAWKKNCLALGTAAAVIDPVGVSNLQLLRSGVSRLASLLPGSGDIGVMAAEFNREWSAEVCHARDFALLHYRLNGRQGEPFWDASRRSPIPASLGYKLQLYTNLGRVAMYDFEPLDEISWINLFDEHGVQPRQVHPIAEGIPVDDLKRHVERVRSVMMDAVRKMPLHANYLAGVKAADQERGRTG